MITYENIEITVADAEMLYKYGIAIEINNGSTGVFIIEKSA